MNARELRKEIAWRTEKRSEIRRAINAYCAEVYGLENYFGRMDTLYSGQKKFALCLARQVPTANIEHAAKRLLVDWLNAQDFACEPFSLALTVDGLYCANSTKTAYYRVPYVFRGRKGNLVVERDRIVANVQEGNILSGLTTVDGRLLPEFHYALREKAFGQRPDASLVDFSPFYQELFKLCLGNNGKKPSHVFIDDNGREVKRVLSQVNGSKISRPPKDWYYPLYLMMFLDGRRALLFTEGDDLAITSMLDEVFSLTKKLTGFEPLMIMTPKKVEVENYQGDLSEVPKYLFSDEEWKKRVAAPPEDSDLYSAMKHFEESLLKAV
jgi:hypothetical protein